MFLRLAVLATLASLPEARGQGGEFLVREGRHRRFEGVDPIDDWTDALDVAFVLGAEQSGEDGLEHRLARQVDLLDQREDLRRRKELDDP